MQSAVKEFEIPNFDLIKRIGEGSYGQVWIAKDLLGNSFAAKVFPNGDDESLTNQEWQGIESYRAISLRHPELLSIYHIGKTSSLCYYIMDLADPIDPHSQEFFPKTLSNLIKRNHHFERKEVLSIARQLALCLDRFHSEDLIHRDIKPSNILFVGGQPRIADIGLVKNLNSSYSFAGTENYMAPEGPRSKQSDIYSFGKVLYELSTSQSVDNFPVLPLDDLSGQNRDFLLELNAVIAQATDPIPQKRYGSSRELANDLEHLRNGYSVRARKKLKKGAVGILPLLVIYPLFYLAFNMGRQSIEKEPLENPLSYENIISEDFGGPKIDTNNWRILKPFPESSVSVEDGQLKLKARGQLVLDRNLADDIEMSGRFKLNHINEFFTVVFRSNGPLVANRYSEFDGIKIAFEGSGKLAIQPLEQVLEYDVELGQWIDFTIRDMEGVVSVYLNHSTTPVFRHEIESRPGKHIGFYNREMAYLTMDVDDITIKEIQLNKDGGGDPQSPTEISSLKEDFKDPALSENIWRTFTLSADAKVSVRNGFLEFKNGGRILSQLDVRPPFELEGRFRIAGNNVDVFRVYLRSTEETLSSEPSKNCLAVGFEISRSPENLRSHNVSLMMNPGTYEVHANYPIKHKAWTTFRIKDNGEFISLTMNDESSPIIKVSSEHVFGNRIGFRNREGLAAGSEVSQGSIVELDYLEVRQLR